jgi:hypothetical protein
MLVSFTNIKHKKWDNPIPLDESNITSVMPQFGPYNDQQVPKRVPNMKWNARYPTGKRSGNCKLAIIIAPNNFGHLCEVVSQRRYQCHKTGMACCPSLSHNPKATNIFLEEQTLLTLG